MQEQTFGPIRFIPGENRGKYPYCHSVYIDGAGILIDPASDRGRLKRLRDESEVKAVWLSHWHEDHFMHIDLFDDLPLWISPSDAPMLTDIDHFLDGYGVEDDSERKAWTAIMTETFHFKPRQASGFLKGGETIQLDTVTVDIIAAPGHTPGHLCFLFKEPGVLFLGDYDLTPFGPWYGDRFSSIAETVASVRHLKTIPAQVWLTCHEVGLFTQPPGDLWEDYLGVIQTREDRLLDFLKISRTLDEIVNAWIVYRKPREPLDFYAFAERALITKHLETLLNSKKVRFRNHRYHRLDAAL